MDLKAEILKEHSKEKTLKIADYIGNDQDRFDKLIALFLNGEYLVTQRSAWVVWYSTEAEPQLIDSHLENLVDNLKNPVHDAVKRNTLKILELVEIPEKLLGKVVDICFEFLDSPKEAIAIRAFSMEVLYKICLREPELSNELKLVIEDYYPHSSAGFKSKARKVIKGISKLEKELE